MTVTPDNRHGVMALLDNVGREDVLRDFTHIEYLSSVHLIHTRGALALETEMVRVNFLQDFFSLCRQILYQNVPLQRIISHLQVLIARRQDVAFPVHRFRQFHVRLDNRHAVRHAHHKRCSVVGHA